MAIKYNEKPEIAFGSGNSLHTKRKPDVYNGIKMHPANSNTSGIGLKAFRIKPSDLVIQNELFIKNVSKYWRTLESVVITVKDTE